MSGSVTSSRSHRSQSSQKSSSSHRSSKSARSHKSQSSQRSNKSSASAPPSLSSNASRRKSAANPNLDSIPEGLSNSANFSQSDSSLLPRQSSIRNRTASTASVRSSSFATVASSRSLYSTQTSSTSASAREKACDSLVLEASQHYTQGNYALTVLLYTQVLGMYASESGNPVEGGTEERVERRMGGWYVRRGEGMWKLAEEKEVFGVFGGEGVDTSFSKGGRRGGSVRGSSSVKSGMSKGEGGEGGGIYGAISRDARMALECERISGCKLTLNSGEPQEEGALVRAKALSLLGYSLLRRGIVEGVSDAFEGCIDVSKTNPQNKDFQKVTDIAKKGLSDLGRYEMLSTRLKKENKSRHNIFLHDLCDVLKISPASDKWNMEMVRFLTYQRRWFAVANYCERMACKVLEVEGIFEGDLKEFSANAGNSAELTPGFFEKTEEKREAGSDKMVLPSYLRMVSDEGAADVALRLPQVLLPIYLRSLRLEERLAAAHNATIALLEMGGWRKECADAKMTALQSTIKLKDEADEQFREGVFERAAELYEQCLKVEEEANPGGKLHAVLHSNRASCFSSLGQYDKAIVECSAALDIHSMFMKALLRRARCHAKAGDLAKSQEDFQRWNMLVEKARRQPYPAINIGPSCFFDMPSEVKSHDWNAVKSEMTELGISVSSPKMNGKKSLAFGGAISLSRLSSSGSRRGIKSSSNKSAGSKKGLFSCCKKGAKNQVVDPPSNVSPKRPPVAPEVQYDDTSSNSSSLNVPTPSSFRLHAPPPRRATSTTAPDPTTASDELQSRRPDPPSHNIIKLGDAGFQKILEPPTKIDVNVNYYETLDCDPTASSTEIKLAYHKLAKLYHPDRSTGSHEKFQEIRLAYEILGDEVLKTKYDKMRLGVYEPWC
ncbi:hypothetical protein ACHAXN_011195 [Cyclotella atomus]